jgi:uncharacterized membrane protein
MEFWIFILTLWAFFRWVQSHVWRKKDDERFARVIEALNKIDGRQNQFKSLESRIQELEWRLANASAPPTSEASTPTAPIVAAEKPADTLAPIKIPPWPEIPKASPAVSPPEPVAPVNAPPPAKPLPAAPPPTPLKPAAVTTPPTSVSPSMPRRVVPPPLSPPPLSPPPLSPPPKPAPVSARELGSQLEQKLGTNWLNKIGIIILVIGVSLFLAIKFPSLNNPEKIALGYLVSFAILGTGIYLERKDRYRVFARALIGGGWALTFFTTYAMHFVPYTRVIETQWIDLVLLFLVAAVMVVHTLRYDSQVVTGLAFLLACTTVTISQNTVYSLSAGVILALGLVAIVHRRNWFELEVFGILASYLNHFVWLARVIVPMAGHHRMFPEFVPSTVLLCLYWALYRWSYISRKIESRQQEVVSTLAAILNTSLLLFLFKYQSVRPELAFYALLFLGAVELTLGQLPVTRRRRAAFAILSSIGTILLIAAIPFKFSGMDTAIIWLAEAQMLLLAGVFVREVLFRRFGLLVALLTVGDMLANQAVPPFFERLSQAAPAPDYQLALSFLVAGVLFYANSLGIQQRWKDLLTSELEGLFFRALSYLAALMLFTSLWLAFPNAWTAVLWASVAFLLVLLGRTLAAEDLFYQMHLFALAAFLRGLTVNSFAASAFLSTGVTVRLVTLSLVTALLYLCARWLSLDSTDSGLHPSEIYTTAAAFLVAVLVYQECHWAWIGVAWGVSALTLAVLGHFGKRRDLSLQAHALVLAGFFRTLIFNFDATQEFGHFSLRLITFCLMAVLLYVCAYFSGPRDSAYAGLFSALHTWAGSILIGILAFKEVSSPWIAVSWALFAFLLLVIGDRVKRIQLHFQAYIFSVSCMFQIFTVNLNASEPFRLYPGVSVRFVTLALVAALFYLCSRWAAKGEFPQAELIGAAYTWVGSFLAGLLLLYELAATSVALGWGLLGLVLLEIGVYGKSRNWRLQSYVAFGMAFLRLAYFNLNAAPRELLFTTLPLAVVFYYAYFRVNRMASGKFPEQFAIDRRLQAAAALAYLGSATLVLFARSYFHEGPSLIAWAALSLLFIGVAWFMQQEVFLHHSVLLALLVFFRALSFEFLRGAHTGASWSATRWYDVAAVATLLFAGQAFAFPIRSRLAGGNGKKTTDGGSFSSFSMLFQRPEQIYFFLSMILVTLLIFNEVSQGRVTIAWGIEAVVAFLFALLVGERSFRLAGLGLLLVCVAKIVVLDVWRQERSDRYVTLIILGLALLLVSFLYTRYSEAIRQYL